MKEGLNLRNEVKRGIAGTLAAVTIGGLTPAMAEGLSENDKLTTPSVSTTESTNGITTSEQGLANLLSDNNLEMASLASTETTIQMDVAAQIVNSRTLVPIKFVAENLGCKVDWNGAEKNQIVTVTNKDTTIIMTKDKNSSVFSNEVSVNGVKKKIDVSGQIINGRTMVPLAFLSENLGLAVSYDKYTKGVGLVDAANSKALTLTINSKEVGIHSNLTAEEQLHYSQEYINAKNVVVDNLNYAFKTNMVDTSNYEVNPFELTASEINTYTKTGSDVGLKTFQVLPYMAEDGSKLPGIIMATGGSSDICKYGNEIKETIDWANSVDPTLMRSIAKTTKYICGNFCGTFSSDRRKNFKSTYYYKSGYVAINESNGCLEEGTDTVLFCLIYVESMAIQYKLNNLSSTAADQEHYKGNCLKNWANEMYSQGKITESMRGDLVGLAEAFIDY